MIFDSLENASLYRNLSPDFALGFEYLKSDRARTDPPGKHEIAGNRVYADVHVEPTQPIEKCRWEAHRKYADIQCILSGCERMGVAPVKSMKATTEYEERRDVTFFEGEGSVIAVPEGMFALFMPHDAHLPGIMNGEPKQVRKVVVKVRVSD